ncbi:MAG: phosphoenolpyruvate hydrolase family protein [Candidatus Sumerlaeia bacterium]|nr:phosphoenolpyruvate hydrolase family protein [Candidatus Sumerlaeia bacterium]
MSKLINSNNTRLVGAAVGSGMMAEAAEDGGADFLLILSAGLFRANGCSSSAALLPFANANSLTWDAAVRTILPRLKHTPTLIGVCAQDPSLHLIGLFKRLRDHGVSGITNFPSVGFLDGLYREAIEEAGLGYNREVEMLARAVEEGFETVGFCFNVEEACKLAHAGVRIINLDLGFAEWRQMDQSEREARLNETVHLTNDVISAVEAINPECRVLIYGGPVVLPQDTAVIYQRTRAHGYIGGSTIECFPAAPLVSQTMRAFKETAARGWNQNRLGSLFGSSPRMREVFELIRLAAESDAPVLVVGESGTGKELVAQEIHRLGARSRSRLVSLNCGAISESLAMSELFGHERGAFTGAHAQHRGKFEQANKATLFMDEIAELPSPVQASLLRVLQEREIVRIGGDRTIPVDVRVIAATNKDLKELVRDGDFRLDLYYRLSIVVLRIPPLRERREDIPALTREIAAELSQRYNLPIPSIPVQVLDAFARHDWPGNVRELRNAVERCLIIGRGAPFRTAWLEDYFELAEALRDHLPQAAKSSTAQDLNGRGTRLHSLLKKHRGNKSEVAREMGVTRKTIYEWLAKYPGG